MKIQLNTYFIFVSSIQQEKNSYRSYIQMHFKLGVSTIQVHSEHFKQFIVGSLYLKKGEKSLKDKKQKNNFHQDRCLMN